MSEADRLFVAHRNQVFRYLSRIVGQVDASELTQEVFLRVARGPVPERDQGALRAWVFHIARNLALNHVRDKGRRGEVEELAEHGAAATQELSVALREALEQLSAIDRDVFLMRESGGLGYDEIARACDLTADAVRSRLHRARLHLRATLGERLRADHAGVKLYGKSGHSD
jgi:RNA polymerase sigma-70 factor (ECF subfamily)